MSSGYYPSGAENDPDAPYNEVEINFTHKFCVNIEDDISVKPYFNEEVLKDLKKEIEDGVQEFIDRQFDLYSEIN